MSESDKAISSVQSQTAWLLKGETVQRLDGEGAKQIVRWPILLFPRNLGDVCVCQQVGAQTLNGAMNIQFAQCVVSISNRLQQTGIYISTWSAAVLTSPALLSSKACAGADSTQVLLLPLVAHLVCFTVIVAHRVMWFTLELSFAISQASAAHQVTILRLAVPLLSNAIVVAAVMAPLRGVTSEVATAQAQACAPQLEACIRHPLPLRTNIMVG